MTETLNEKLKEKIQTFKDRKLVAKKSIMLGGEPFLYKKGRVGCYLVHGWSSTPQELRGLGEYLSQKGISVYAPLLPGHGTSPEDLKDYTCENWLAYAKKELEEFKQEVDTMFVGGVSMGGNICFHLAKSDPSIKGVISMATPALFKYNFLLKAAYPFIKSLNMTIKKHYPFGKERKALLKTKVHYRRYPLKSVGEAFRMGWSLKKVLPDIKQPTLIMQSNTDFLLKEKNAYYIYQRLGSKDKKLTWIPNSYHVFTIDHYKERAFEEVYQFIQQNISS